MDSESRFEFRLDMILEILRKNPPNPTLVRQKTKDKKPEILLESDDEIMEEKKIENIK